MIEILETKTENQFQSGLPEYRSARIIITSGPSSYLLDVGGLPLTGDLQAVLDAREAELFAAAAVGGKPVDLYELTVKRVLKAFALVMLDEINILRQAVVPALPARTGAQLEAALKNKLKNL